MATFSAKSTEMTNFLAAPPVLTNGYISGATIKEKIARIEVLAALTTGDTYAAFTLPSNARVSSLELVRDVITTTGSFDIGLYTVDQKSGAYTVVDVNHFADNYNATGAAVTAWLDVNYQAVAARIDEAELRLYERSGIALTADPKVQYVVALTARDDTATDGTIILRVRYAV